MEVSIILAYRPEKVRAFKRIMPATARMEARVISTFLMVVLSCGFIIP